MNKNNNNGTVRRRYNSRKIFYLEYIHNGKRCNNFIKSYTKDGAIMLLREYLNISPKEITVIEEATRERYKAAEDKRVMCYSYMMVPIHDGEITKR